MLTADTITDEQIRELRAWAEDITAACRAAQEPQSTGADGPYRHRVAERINVARARCAEILNARESKP